MRAQAPWPAGTGLIVLTGGASRRLGRDKASTHVGTRPLLDRLLDQVPEAVPVVVVGPPDEVPARARVAREDPPGCGPLAGIAAGVELTAAPLVCVLAADMPFAIQVVRTAAARLTEPDLDAVVPVDPDGFAQPLCAAYRTVTLRAALATLIPLAGRPVRALLPLLRVVEWSVPAADLADVDTERDLAAARSRAAEEATYMQEWVEAVRAALGLDVDLDIDAVLDVARDAAHAVARPAAPVTTYLLGAAVAGGADPKQVAATIAELAAGWTPTEQ